MVEVKNLGTFYDFCKPRGLFTISASRPRPSAEIRVVEVQKLRTFYDFCGPRATLCGDSHGQGSKTEDFLQLSHGRGSKTVDFLRGDRACRSALAVAPCEFFEPSAEIVRVKALSLWRRAILLLAKWPLEVVSWFARLLSQSRGRGFDSPLVRGSSGLKIAAFKNKRSTLLQLRLENRNF